MWYMPKHDKWFSFSSQKKILLEWNLGKADMLADKEMKCNRCSELWFRDDNDHMNGHAFM